MAKLKITDAGGVTILDQGYVNVVEHLIMDSNEFDRYKNTAPNLRPSKLQGYAGTGFAVTQEGFDGNQNLIQEAITNSNCRIFGEPEKRHEAPHHAEPNKPSLTTTPLPVGPMTDFTYLEPYAQKVHDLYRAGVTAGDLSYCCKFLFGIMMLTRCR